MDAMMSRCARISAFSWACCMAAYSPLTACYARMRERWSLSTRRIFVRGTNVVGMTFSTRYEENAHTEDDLLDLLKARAQDNLYLGREQGTLRWAVGCTVGELSGRVFPLTGQEQSRKHPMSLRPPSSFVNGRRSRLGM